MSLIPSLRGLKKEDEEFKVSPSYIVGFCLKNKQANKGHVDVGKREHRREGP